jgi:hypothetical protein
MKRLAIAILPLAGIAAVAAAAIIVALFAGRGPGVTNAAANGSATIEITAPGSAQPLNTPFQVPADLSSFAPGTSTTWAGYDFELAYDTSVLQVDSDARGLCSTGAWSNDATSPHVVSLCAFQSNTSTGTLETITFECKTNGPSALTLLSRTSPGLQGVGTALFDDSATDFSVTLNSGSVTCDSSLPQPATPTETNTPTVTSTATITSTATATATPAGTSTMTATATATPQRDSATFTMIAPVGAQPLGVPFQFTSNLSALQFVTQSTWGGYQFTMAYDGSIIEILSVVPALCSPINVWSNPYLAPDVLTSCLEQQSTSTGVVETFTAMCVRQGESPLHMVPGDVTSLFSPGDPVPFVLTLVDSSITCAAGPTLTPTATPTNTSTATATPTGTFVPATPAATLSMIGPAEVQPLNAPFQFTSNLSALSLTGTARYWAGYEFELAYDASVIQIDTVVPDLCKPLGAWGVQTTAPHVSTGCAFQQETSVGSLETMTARCLKDGTSPLHIVPSMAPGALALGTDLFDFQGSPVFAMTFHDGSVTCDHNALADEDGDGCIHAKELLLGLDPLNPWDFYSVPVPPLFAAPDPTIVFKDNMVSSSDAQAVFGYFKAGAKTGTPVYEQDLNNNGVKDGLEYDRSVIGPAKSGPPDGVVTVRDAQLAFAQFKLGYRC